MSSIGPSSALDRLLQEVRAQRPPEPRDAALPPRLRDEFRSLAAQPRSALRRTGTRRIAGWQLGVAAALAAGALLLLRSVEPGRLAERTGAEHGEWGPSLPAVATIDGQPLAPGVALEALSVPRAVQHSGRASWLLLPGSRARLGSAGPVVRVELEQGSMSAHVRPSEQPEAFVVQAGGTEVAVRGTRFSVSLQGERVRVEVVEGSVQVRPTGQSAGTLLGEGMRGDFLAGELLPPPAAQAQPPALSPGAGLDAEPAPEPRAGRAVDRAPARAPAARRGPAPEPASDAPAAPRDPASERALQGVIERVHACFRRHLPGSSELGIEVSTRVLLWVEASGQLLRVDFEPPLAPSIESCAAEQLAQFRAAPSPQGYRVERDVVLQR